MRKSSLLLSSVFVIGVLDLGLPCAGQRDGVLGESGTVQAGTGFIGGSLTLGPGLMRLGPPITGEPYSGEIETERTRILRDGTHIDQKRKISRMYRDSQGRTRTERLLFQAQLQGSTTESGPRLIQIYDPVAGYNYTLDLQKQIAHRVAVSTHWEGPPKSTQSPAGHTNGRPASQATGGLQGAGLNGPHGRNIKREPLGTEMIDGVEAAGWRTTITTPVGAMGNDKPITRVCETWNATELQVLVLSKCSDPRSGHSTMRLKNLDRAEPDAGLFQVPPDYTIMDDKDRFTMNFSEP